MLEQKYHFLTLEMQTYHTVHTYTHYIYYSLPLNCPLIQIAHFPPKRFFEISLIPLFACLFCYCLHVKSTILSICCFHLYPTESGEVINVVMVEKLQILLYIETQ